MKIPLSVLCYMLPEVITAGLITHAKNEYRCMMLFQRGLTIEPDVICIGNIADMDFDPLTNYKRLTIVPVGADESTCKKIAESLGCVCLCFHEEYTLAQVHMQIQRVFDSLHEWVAVLDDALYCSSTVQELVKKAEGIINDPILVWDPAFQLIACANTDNLSDDETPPLMRSCINGNGWSGEDVEIMIKKHDYLTMPMRYMDTRLLAPPNMMNCYSCVRNFSIFGKIVMTAGVYYLDGKKPHDGKIELVQILFSRLMKFFERNSSTYTGIKKIYERFIIELVEGKLTSQTDISDRLCYLNFPYNGEFEVIVIGCNNNVQPMALGIVRNYCKSFFRYAKFVEHSNHLVGLNNRLRDSAADIERRRNVFSSESNVNDFSLGISSTFDCLINTEQAFNQAKVALQYGKKLHHDRQYYTYEEYCVYYMLHQLHPITNSKTSCPDSAYIYKLRDMDRKKKGLYNEKLFTTFVKSGNNTSFTAEAMNLHRNSILYRIKQIEGILGIDLAQRETMFHMMLGIKAVELNDALERESAKEQIDEN